MMLNIITIVTLLFVATAAVAEETAVPAALPEGATQIDATDALEWNKQAQTYTARGNARAQKGDMVITADTLVAHYRDKNAAPADVAPQQSGNNIYQVEAHGNVHIVQGDYTAQGDDGTYNLDKKFYRLTGTNLKATTNDTTITARDSLDYDQAADRAYARGAAKAVQTDKTVSGDLLTGVFGLDAAGQRGLKFVYADGHAVVTSPQDIIHADHGVYDLAAQISTVTGNVKITQGQNQLEGNKGEMNMQTGISRLLPAVDEFGQKTRVRVLLYQDNKGDKSAAPAPDSP